jgi:hypothetical protein
LPRGARKQGLRLPLVPVTERQEPSVPAYTFEIERRKPLKIVRTLIQQAFEQAGIEFFDDNGLRLKKK